MRSQLSLFSGAVAAPASSSFQRRPFALFTGPCIGVDEAGRGCLAGPVVAGAVLLPDNMDIPALLPGLADSKKLRARQREALNPAIRRHALAWSLGLSWPWEIDRINILNATFRAMSRAVASLTLPFPLTDCHLAVDGVHTIRPDEWRHATSLPLPGQQAVIGGDALIPAVSAASVLAKVFRDRLMAALDARYPGYGFAVHKGYGTQAHINALLDKGACRMHRRTFRGVRPESRLSLM